MFGSFTAVESTPARTAFSLQWNHARENRPVWTAGPVVLVHTRGERGVLACTSIPPRICRFKRAYVKTHLHLKVGTVMTALSSQTLPGGLKWNLDGLESADFRNDAHATRKRSF